MSLRARAAKAPIVESGAFAAFAQTAPAALPASSSSSTNAPDAIDAALIADVCTGLTATPKTLPSKYLYDDLGSALFEAICRLPWYEVTRAEQRLLECYAVAIGALADPRLIVELGPGSGDKLATLVRPLSRAQPSLHLHLIDISPAALDQASRTVGQLSHVRVTTSRATYDDGLRELPRLHTQLAHGKTMVLFLGSNIGNFDPPQSAALLRNIRAALRPGDTLLLGLDLVKPDAVLQLAYDDPLGVTAAFNKNMLTRLNSELGADFDLDRFAHQARWVEDESRIEMHLVSRGAQTVRIPGANCTIAFEDGESIWTENSYKYYPEDADRLGADAGFRAVDQWVDGAGRFALTLFEA
jgi:dimethylhistidine N-methyltransferase